MDGVGRVVEEDGKRFVMIEGSAGGETLHVVVNWTEEREARVPRDNA